MNEVNYILVDGLKVEACSIRYWREQLEMQKNRVAGLRGHLTMIADGNADDPSEYAQIALELDEKCALKNGVES